MLTWFYTLFLFDHDQFWMVTTSNTKCLCSKHYMQDCYCHACTLYIFYLVNVNQYRSRWLVHQHLLESCTVLVLVAMISFNSMTSTWTWCIFINKNGNAFCSYQGARFSLLRMLIDHDNLYIGPAPSLCLTRSISLYLSAGAAGLELYGLAGGPILPSGEELSSLTPLLHYTCSTETVLVCHT